MRLLYNRWLVCLIAIFFTILSISAIFIFRGNDLVTIMLILFSVFGIYNSIIETFVAITFIAPGKVKPSLENDDWELIRLQHAGPEVVVFRNLRSEKAPIMLMIHGWRSSS